MSAWQTLGAVSPGALGAARAELHHATAAVEQVGKALIEPEDGYAHIALRWSARHEALVTAPVDSGARAGLRLAGAELLETDPGGEVAATRPLAGGTLEEAAAWVRERMAARSDRDPEWRPLRREGLPDIGLARGGAFSDPGPSHQELDRWFANAAAVLEGLAAERSEAGPVLCWPHHFDIATRLDYEPDLDPEEARSVGLGLSPGDEAAPEPYFYVLPWPEPDASDLPDLDGLGGWVTGEFVGARLRGSELLELDAIAQEGAAVGFLRNGLEASERALGL